MNNKQALEEIEKAIGMGPGRLISIEALERAKTALLFIENVEKERPVLCGYALQELAIVAHVMKKHKLKPAELHELARNFEAAVEIVRKEDQDHYATLGRMYGLMDRQEDIAWVEGNE